MRDAIAIPTHELRKAVDEQREFCRQNLKKACQEILQWQKECVLSDGVVRQIARMAVWEEGHYRLSHAESLVRQIAMEAIAQAPD